MNAEDLDIFARTIWGEARGEPLAGRHAVACVIMNRVKRGGWWGSTIKDVCLHPWQFSCWNEKDPNRMKVEEVTLDDEAFQRCYYVALAAGLKYTHDTTLGSTHYHAKGILPDWANGAFPVCSVGNHLFYNDVS